MDKVEKAVDNIELISNLIKYVEQNKIINNYIEKINSIIYNINRIERQD